MNGVEQRYLRALRSRVCLHCQDLIDGRLCGLSERACPVERNLREILQIVHHYQADTIQPYLNELRRIICSACDEQAADGRCPLRDQANCALDRYFALVLETIEDVHEEIRAEAAALSY